MEAIRTLRLDKKNSKGYCPIRITCYFEGKRVFLSPGISVEEKNWDDEKKKVKSKDPAPLHKNQILDRWEQAANDVRYLATAANQQLSVEEFKKRVEVKYAELSAGPSPAPPVPDPKGPDFFSLYDQFLTAKAKEISPVTKKRIAPSTIVSLDGTRQRLLHFATVKHRELTLEGMDLKFYNAFRDYVLNEAPMPDGSKGQSVNNFGKHIRHLKTFLTWCEDQELAVNLKYRKFDAPESYVGVDSLFPHEVRKLYDFDFNTDEVKKYILDTSRRKFGKALNRLQLEQRLQLLGECRDAFLFGCSTGLSISDAFAVKEATHVRNGLIIIPRTKTSNECYIPLVDDDLFRAQYFIDKYREKQKTCIPVIRDINKHLKDIAHLVGIGISRLNLSYKIARKTYVTNKVYQGVPTRLIMQSTGHKTEAAFNRYLGVDVEELKRQFQLISNKQKVA
jgi:hypothetical protein